jgi:hypothetical protein
VECKCDPFFVGVFTGHVFTEQFFLYLCVEFCGCCYRIFIGFGHVYYVVLFLLFILWGMGVDVAFWILET